MTLKRFISKVRGTYLHRFKPLKYAKLIGVNFPWGGYTCMKGLSGVLNCG